MDGGEIGQEKRLAPFDHNTAAHTSREDTHTETLPVHHPRKHIWPVAGRAGLGGPREGGWLVHSKVALVVAHAPLPAPTRRGPSPAGCQADLHHTDISERFLMT